MSNHFLTEIFQRNRSMMNMECALNLYYLLSKTLDLKIQGDVAELGCYRGLTAVMFQKTMRSHGSDKSLHVFDSFEGLPKKTQEDLVTSKKGMREFDILDNERIDKGWFKATRASLEAIFESYQVPLPQIHEGWFKDTLAAGLPTQLSFVHLDGDFYESTVEGLEAIYPRLSPGAIVVLDDYCDPKIHSKQSAFPGVKNACDEFFAKKPEVVEVLAGGKGYQAMFQKL